MGLGRGGACKSASLERSPGCVSFSFSVCLFAKLVHYGTQVCTSQGHFAAPRRQRTLVARLPKSRTESAQVPTSKKRVVSSCSPSQSIACLRESRELMFFLPSRTQEVIKLPLRNLTPPARMTSPRSPSPLLYFDSPNLGKHFWCGRPAHIRDSFPIGLTY